jgi:uncharacterized coiled-coil protein SlyX
MMAVEDRLAHVEGLVTGQTQLLGDLRTAVTSLEARIDRRFDLFESRFTQMDGRFTVLEGRVAALDQKIDSKVAALDQKIDSKVDALDRKIDSKIDAIDRKLDTLDRKLEVRFQWTLGVMVTLAVAVFTAVLAG